MHDALMTSIVLKPGITLLDIVSTRMLGQVGFMATVFDIFNSNGISVDVVATSEVSISLTLDPRYAAYISCFHWAYADAAAMSMACRHRVATSPPYLSLKILSMFGYNSCRFYIRLSRRGHAHSLHFPL